MKNNTLIIQLILLLPFLFGTPEIKGQYQDTLLNTVISKPFFYNILKSEGNKLFAGTSEGIFEVEDVTLRPYSDEKGYITINKEGKPVIDKNGIKFHRSTTYNYLLPYAQMVGEYSYYVGLEKMFYLCSGGVLCIFDILPYQRSLQHHSIRSISKNLVGSYSGIYLNNMKLGEPAPPFTDGYVRQIGDRGFICSYSLLVLEKEAMESGQLRLDTNCFNFKDPDGLLVSDIVPGKDGRSYYVATADKLILADHSFKKDSILFKKKEKNQPIILIPGDGDRLFFIADKELLLVRLKTNVIESLRKLNEPIQAGIYVGDQIYLLTQNSLLRFNSEHKLEKLTDLEQAHTIGAVGDDQLIIGSNLGLFHYNLVSNTLSAVIKNVEFNRSALYINHGPKKENDNLSAGSINGLYTFRINDIPNLIASNKTKIQKYSLANVTIFILGTLLLGLLITLILTVRKNRQNLVSAQKVIEELQTPKKEIVREDIESYIINNLSNASIKTLTDEFGLNAPQLYSILKPDRPGSIIQKLRLEKVREMREKNKTVKEIAEATGLSEAYLKKIKT